MMPLWNLASNISHRGEWLIASESGSEEQEIVSVFQYALSLIKTIRIYERSFEMEDKGALDVLADALMVRDLDSADRIIREYGVVGCWRPSTIQIVSVSVGNVTFVRHVPAYAIWETRLDAMIFPAQEVRLVVHNHLRRERLLMPVATVAPVGAGG